MEFFEEGLVAAKESTGNQLKGGIDSHKKGCNICLLNEKGEVVKSKRIRTDIESLDKFFSPFVKDYDVEVALEAGNLAFVICDNLSFLGVKSYIVNPLKNRVIADSFQKTDKIDAKTLAFQLLKGVLPPRVYHPTYRERELRSLVNHRHKLVGDRTRIANRTHSLLLRNGIFSSKSNLRNQKRYWENLHKEKIVLEGGKLSRGFKKYMEQYQLCDKQIFELEKEIEEQLESMCPSQYKLLLSIPGVGLCISSAVLAYLGIVERFKNVRKFWSYYGLAPKVRKTDGKNVGSSGITKMGPSLLRGYLTQAALSILKSPKKEENEPFIEFYQRIRVKKGWKKARVALGKKILGTIYGVLKNQTAYASNYAELNCGKSKDGVVASNSVGRPPGLAEEVETEKESSSYPDGNVVEDLSADQYGAAETIGERQACKSTEKERLLSIEEIKGLHMPEFLTHHYQLSFSPFGTQHVCRSPFTDEKNPSFIVGQFEGHWLFKDFSSGHGGSIIDFVLKKENYCNVGEALAHLRRLISGGEIDWLQSKRNGLGVGGMGGKNSGKGDYNLGYIYRKLCANKKEVCWKYLGRRGIDQKLIFELSDKGILLNNHYKGHSYCCFAVFDHQGGLCCLDSHQIEGKRKFVLGKKHIFTLDWAELPGAKKVFVSEGIIDYLSIKTIEPTMPGIALLGNAPNFDEALVQSADVIVSALDCDAGGIKALLNLKEKFPHKEISPYNFAGCKDPNEYLQTIVIGKKVKNKMLDDNNSLAHGGQENPDAGKNRAKCSSQD